VSESIWKKEIRLRKKPEPLPPLPAQLLERSRVRAERPAGHVVVPVVPADGQSNRLERWTPQAPAPSVERPATVEFPKPVTEPGPDPVALLPASAAAPDLPQPALAYGWPKQPDTPPAAAEPSAVVEPEPEPAVEAPSAEPETVAPAEKVPLLKREIKLGRSRDPKAPKPAKLKTEPKKEPKQKRERRRAKPPESAPVAAAAPVKEKTPLLKRELSFRRTPKPKATTQSAGGRGEHNVKRVVGLRIGASQLSAAHVRNNGSAELVQLARKPIEAGLVVGGEVRDAEGLTRAVKAFFADNKLPRKDVRLGIASNRIGVRMLDLPAIDDAKQFENALRFRAQELLPIPVSDAILDHVVLEEWANDDGEALRRVLVVFAHRELVNRFVDVCRGAGVRLAGIDLDPFALLRAVAEPRSGDAEPGDAVVAVAIGHDRTIIAVSDGRVCDFTRVLEWGGSSLDVAIARTVNLTPSQAEPIKLGLDLAGDGMPEGLSAVQLEAVKGAVRDEIGVLGRELVSSLRFYQSRPDSLAIGEVLLAGGTAQLAGLTDELRRIVGAPVRVADPLARVVMGKKLRVPEDASSLAIAIGLGIED
jgi:type IV pilus assembly protein PilM